jgi:hypothetical protein
MNKSCEGRVNLQVMDDPEKPFAENDRPLYKIRSIPMKTYVNIAGILSLVLIWGCSPQGSKMDSASLMDEEIGQYPAAVKYVIDWDVDYEKEKIFGECELTVRNPSGSPMTIIPLILYRLMDVNVVTDEAGNPLNFAQRVLKFEDWEQLQVNHIRIALEPALPPGATKTVRISYGGHLLGCAEAMRYVKDTVSKEYTMLRTDSNVYPRIGTNSWEANRSAGLGRHDFRVSVRIPEGLTAANSGKLVSKEITNGRATYTFESRVPSWRIDVAITDFAVLESPDGLLKIYFLPEDRDGAERILGAMVGTMGLCEKWFGPLKVFEGLTVIEVPAGYGSQADVAAIIQQASGFREEGKFYEFYHELSHLWNVTAADPLPPRFESEGMGMFLQHFVEEKLEGKTDALKDAVRLSLERMGKYFIDHPEALEVPMIEYGTKQLTDLSYRMGQILYYLLYEKMGEGDFLAAVGGFYQDYYETGATARQFMDYFKAKSDFNLEPVFEEWVFTSKAAELLQAGIALPELLARYK